MIDCHTHLDLYPDALHLLPVVAGRNTFTLAVTTSPRAWKATSALFRGFDRVEVAVGLHPEIAAAKAGELQLLLDAVSAVRFVGEIGLDGTSRFRQSLRLQESVFSNVLTECEHQGGRILSIHSRGAATRTLGLLERHSQAGKAILHWFTGTTAEIQRAQALGCWFSVGPAALTTQAGRTAASKLPMERVLPESDGPFAVINGRPVMPWEAIDIADVLAPLWGGTRAGAILQMKANLCTLLGHEDAPRESPNTTP
jgi:TatD DNase family protein